MIRIRHTLGVFAVLVGLGMGGANSAIEPVSAAPAPKTVVLKTRNATISFPASIKITPRKCGEIKIKYSVNASKAFRSDIAIKNEGGEWIGYQAINRFSELKREWDPAKGTKYFEYCRSDWIDESGSEVAGVAPGWLYVELIEQSGESAIKKKNRFLVNK